jgi:hypothetical protein
VELKSFCTTKEIGSKLEITHRMGENISLYITQRTDSKNIQGAQKTKFPQN